MTILSIDPSGTGTTGIAIIKKEEVIFFSYSEKEWKKHFFFIKEKIEQFNPDKIIFEDTNFIIKKTKDGIYLLKLLGAIEATNSEKIIGINVILIKKIKKEILKKIKTIDNLTYSAGRGGGWKFKEKKITVHCLDAYIAYISWKKKKKILILKFK